MVSYILLLGVPLPLLLGGLVTGLVLRSWNEAIGWRSVMLLAGGWMATILPAILGDIATHMFYREPGGNTAISSAAFFLLIGAAGGVLDLIIVRRALSRS